MKRVTSDLFLLMGRKWQPHLQGLQVVGEVSQQAGLLLRLEDWLTLYGPIKAGQPLSRYVSCLPQHTVLLSLPMHLLLEFVA